jgi:hypothetical protein
MNLRHIHRLQGDNGYVHHERCHPSLCVGEAYTYALGAETPTSHGVGIRWQMHNMPML